MTCIIIEDQPPAQRILQKYIEDMGSLELKGVFSDALQAMEYLRKEEVGLIFLDINLPKLSGLDFLKSFPHPPNVILTTAYSEFALESYEWNVVDYLLKPFSFERFVKAVAKVPSGVAMGNTQQEKPLVKDEIYIKSGYEHIRLKVAEVLYIKSDADYTEIITRDKKLLSGEPLRYWESYLDPLKFIRCHKSYIINTSSILKISGNRVYLSNQEKVPIGRAYKEDFIRRVMGPS